MSNRLLMDDRKLLVKRESPSSEVDGKASIKRTALGDLTNKPTTFETIISFPKKKLGNKNMEIDENNLREHHQLRGSIKQSNNNNNNNNNNDIITTTLSSATTTNTINQNINNSSSSLLLLSQNINIINSSSQASSSSSQASTSIIQASGAKEGGLKVNSLSTQPSLSLNLNNNNNNQKATPSSPPPQQQEQSNIKNSPNNGNQKINNNNNSNSNSPSSSQTTNSNSSSPRQIDPATEFQHRMAQHIWGIEWNSIEHFDIDADVDNDTLYVVEYINEIHDNVRKNQLKTQPKDYMMYQTDINQNMRSVLVDWIVDIAFDLRMRNETVFLAVNYLDRYLSVSKVRKDQFQLIGAACFLIACKYEEVTPPATHQIINLAGNYFSIDQLVEAEYIVLKSLNFVLTAPTIKFFLSRYLRAAATTDSRVSALAHFYGELSLLDYSLMNYLPSIVAASCVYLALITTNNQWSSTLTFYTRVFIDDPFFKQCVRLLWNLHNNVEMNLVTIRNKYTDHIRDIHPLPYLP